ncbi:P22AR C-terminal domain-containing protein [Citrobacter portucalensis]|uniref:P22AR C-terminal domain-containing protein n=2 Tax=Citrobacter TaxID=544 RepID=UPI003EE2AD65
MNMVAKSDYNFHGVSLSPVDKVPGIWLTSTDVAKALGYKNTKSITNLFNQNADEFSDGMTQVIESVTSGNYRKKVRVFSLRGAHLIAMFARTDVAKEFRRWVLDILDREVHNSPIAQQFSDEELCRLAWMWNVSNRMQDFAKDMYPALRDLKSAHAGKFHDFGSEFRWTFEESRKALEKATAHIQCQPERDDNWARVLPKLRKEIH